MGTVITIILAAVIFGFGLTAFFKAIKKEAVEGACASCGPDKNCCNKKKVTTFSSLDSKK